jgi:hypothetical protein
MSLHVTAANSSGSIEGLKRFQQNMSTNRAPLYDISILMGTKISLPQRNVGIRHFSTIFIDFKYFSGIE